MELHHKIEKAQRIVDSFGGDEAKTLRRICHDIRSAQDALNDGAHSFFNACIQSCQGICCKNINVNDVVTELDLVYVLAMKREMADQMIQSAETEALYTADCPFLEKNVGPCIFPSNVKPERCIITFCGETRPIRREIKAVRARFTKLSRYTLIKRPFLWIRF